MRQCVCLAGSDDKIADRNAVCARNELRVVVGGLLLGGTPPDNWIRWLAVRNSARDWGLPCEPEGGTRQSYKMVRP